MIGTTEDTGRVKLCKCNPSILRSRRARVRDPANAMTPNSHAAGPHDDGRRVGEQGTDVELAYVVRHV
eukprot:1031706-Prorocentrum_lima.AAC.1